MSTNEILTDANGKPFQRPSRQDFADVIDYMRAVYEFNDRVAAYAGAEFARGFNAALRKVSTKRVA